MKIGGREVPVNRPAKVLFPDEGITKEELADYYARAAAVMLRHVRERPLHMRRFADGVGETIIDQKRVPRHFPDWVGRARVPRKAGGSLTQALVEDAATLVYLAGQAIEPHVWLSRVPRLDYPDLLVFDLDPPRGEFATAREGAQLLRELLEELGLVPYVKTTGGRGLHVTSALDRKTDFDGVRAFAQDVARLLALRHSARITTEQRKQKRRGRLFLDTLRNAYAQTVIAPYAVRARPGAPVATPVEWDELGRRGFDPRRLTLRSLDDRLDPQHDPWAGLRRGARSLRQPERRLRELLRDAT
jgi:bifunctional non-homologous end joining protein LigD